MLGLRAMYFAVASFMRSFHYLHYGFASIIIILGIKMLLTDVYQVLENVFQLEQLRVRDAMKARARARMVQADAPWDANRRMMVATRCHGIRSLRRRARRWES